MKKLIRILALALAVIMMVGLLAACNKNKEGGSGSKGEPVTLVVYLANNAKTDTDEVKNRMSDKINEITKAKLNITCDIHWIPRTDYTNTVTLDVGNGVAIDVIQQNNALINLVTNKVVMDLTPYVDKYAPEAKKLLGDLLNASKYGGKIMSIPTYSQTRRGYGTTFYLDQFPDGIGKADCDAVKSWDDLESLMGRLLKAYNNEFVIIGTPILIDRGILWGSDSDMSKAFVTENLGDTYNVLYADGKTVKSTLELADFANSCARVARWRDLGYLWEDSYLNGAFYTGKSCIQFGATFEPDQNSTNVMNGAPQRYYINNFNTMLTSTDINYCSWCVPVTSKEPEAATRLINLFVTDKDLNSLLVQGVEGIDYVKNSNGTIDYPEGKNFSTVDWHQDREFLGYSNLLLNVWSVYNDPNYKQKAAQMLEKDGPISSYLGFNCDLSGISAQANAVSVVFDEYFYRLTRGMYTPQLLDEYKNALKTAGYDTYIATYQEQLDTWLAGK